MTPDRRVHARTKGFEVVRYERAGKWFIERDDDTRRQVSFDVAVSYGRVVRERGGEVFYRLPGGSRFDAKVAQ